MADPMWGFPLPPREKLGVASLAAWKRCSLHVTSNLQSLPSRSSLPQTHRVLVCELTWSCFVYILNYPSLPHPTPPGKLKVTFK